MSSFQNWPSEKKVRFIADEIENIFTVDPVKDLVQQLIALGVTEGQLNDAIKTLSKVPDPAKIKVRNLFRDERQRVENHAQRSYLYPEHQGDAIERY